MDKQLLEQGFRFLLQSEDYFLVILGKNVNILGISKGLANLYRWNSKTVFNENYYEFENTKRLCRMLTTKRFCRNRVTNGH